MTNVPSAYVFRKILRSLASIRDCAARDPGDRAELVSRLAMLRMMAAVALENTEELSGISLAEAEASLSRQAGLTAAED